MGTDFAAVARLLASPGRSAAVGALMDGRALAAGELAQLAGLRPSTMSEHLAELVNGGLLAVVPAGRHRYYRLASAEVATALEALSRICPATPSRSLRQSIADRSLCMARVCYDHIAGALGVALLDRMLEAGWLSGALSITSLQLTDAGASRLAEIGVDVASCERSRRHFASTCLDWSERRMHLAGALGAGIATALINRSWLCRADASRGVRITSTGEDGLRAFFAIDIKDLKRR
ncbi:MAG TPA: winged helix-turn-helix domain-containing protein [Streptosporangiaceae bacterium]